MASASRLVDIQGEVQRLNDQPEPVVPSYNAPTDNLQRYNEGQRLIRQGWLWLLFFPPVGFKLLERGRALANPDSYTALKMDRRRPVVYLRAFSADKQRSLGAVDQVNAVLNGLPNRTIEIQLAQAINNNFSRRYGPFIAIGQPQQPPNPGFAKCYVADEHWKRVALSMIQQSQLTILRIGDGDGIFWELLAAFLVSDIERIMLVFDPTSIPAEKLQATYDEIAETLSCYFGIQFPASYNGSRVIRFREDKSAILQRAGMLATLLTGGTFAGSLRRASRAIPTLEGENPIHHQPPERHHVRSNAA